MLTRDQADNRAQLIWGALGELKIQTRPDGGFDVETPGSRPQWHRLDDAGHAACHQACRRLEEFYCYARQEG